MSQEDTKNIHRLVWIGIFLAVSLNCAKDPTYVEIHLPDDERLEDTIAGRWIKELDLDYKYPYLSRNIHERLPEIGETEDVYYFKKKKGHLVTRWVVHGRTETFILYEHMEMAGGGEDERLHIGYEIIPSKDGVPFMMLIGKEATAACIHSKRDRCRLYLSGPGGDYCTSIFTLD